MQVTRIAAFLFVVLSLVISNSQQDGDPDSDEQFEQEADQASEPVAESGPQAPPPAAESVAVEVPMENRVAVGENNGGQEQQQEQQGEEQGEQEQVQQQSVGPQPVQQAAQAAPKPQNPLHVAAAEGLKQAFASKEPEQHEEEEQKSEETPQPTEVHEQVAKKEETPQPTKKKETPQPAEVHELPAPQHLMAQPTHEAQAAADAQNAHTAAETAMHAASVANKVAVHSVHITKHAKAALKDAREALHAARVDTKGLSGDQKESLKKAEAKLREATKKAQYGDVKNAKYVKADVDNKRLQKLDNKMEEVKATKGNSGDELDALMQSIDELQHQLKEKGGDNDIEAALIEIEDDLKEMKESGKYSEASLDEMKAEIEKLRVQIATLESESDAKPVAPAGIAQEEKSVQLKPLDETPAEEEEATPIEPKGIDIDTAMPYGDLEPFGREDTAQELTEDSIRESDGMVDQLERAEVAEEKRAVFRALTRLRGAAITSFDGIARSQTGNIDEYNKVHQWRSTHPLHHLADEESDVSKWAFPDNAD